jgi:hypothetical protein
VVVGRVGAKGVVDWVKHGMRELDVIGVKRGGHLRIC